MKSNAIEPKLILSTAPRRSKLTWQIFTEHHSAAVKNVKVQEVHHYLGAAERWMTFAEDRSITFPAETFAPKIQMPFITAPKQLPRSVEMERKRRIYKSIKVEEALEKKGIFPRDILPPAITLSLCTEPRAHESYFTTSYLPLEIFDDEEYDCRTPDDWVNLGVIDGTRHPLPAVAFVKNPRYDENRKFSTNDHRLNQIFAWYYVAVAEYNAEKKLWTVFTLDGFKRTCLLPRIYIRFFAEDPNMFAERIAAALECKRQAEACIRYNFYLDCMQVDGIPGMTEEQREAIIRSSVRQGALKFKSDTLAALTDEIVLDYGRTMYDLMWRKLMEQYPEMFPFDQCKPTERSTKIPKKGKIDTNMTNFQQTKNYFHWSVLYVLPEVYEAMTHVVAECARVANMNLFVSNYGKAMSLSEFMEQQNQMTTATIKYLKELWVEKITQSVKMSLRHLGKGWFNLEQKIHCVYDVMKLKRFMHLITLRMQYALRVLVENSIALYLNTLESPALCSVNVDEGFVWGDNLVDTQFRPTAQPVFSLNIMMDSNAVYYSTDPDLFEETIVSLYENSLILCHHIKQVHPFLLTFLKFSPDLYLSSVGLLEKGICDIRDRLRIAYRKAIVPLKAYAKEYLKYLALFVLDVPKYIEDFKSEDHSAPEVKEEISFHLRMKLNLETTLPTNICIGPFNVNVRPLKEFLVQKRWQCATRLLVMFVEKLRVQVDEILSDYDRISGKLNEVPQNVEHLFELREWMETVPLTVKRLDDAMQRLKLEFDILDHFWWSLSDEDFQAKWEAIGYPRRIQFQTRETTERFTEEQAKFYKIQVQDEMMLLEKIDTLVGNVTNIALQTDINKVHETAIEVKRIWKTMKECQETGLMLNERQKLLGMEVVPFERLNKLMKEFEPYRNLWSTASEWLKWYEIWMENPLMNVDGKQIDSMVMEMHKVMSRCIKTFQEFPKVSDVALTIRLQIEAFKPYIGMIQALRDPGMKERHFADLSLQTGIQMALTPSLTFKNLIVLGIMEFEEMIKTVAEAAAKEYSIEGTLDKMIAEWEVITMDIIPYKNTNTYIMKIPEEILMLLDDHILSTQQISFSPFKVVFGNKIEEWDYKLKLTQDVITPWIEVQKQWMYLEPIFASEDISRQLPVETRKFKIMDRIWRRVMKNAHDCPYIIRTCPDKTLLESLKECLSLLELVQKGLSDYLETKRMIFPRFFFLSDDELLEILSHTKNVEAVQPHLKKCFENMKELRFEYDLMISRMYSAEYEEVVLRPPIYPEGNVEDWLGQVEVAMRNTLREIIGEALDVVETTLRKHWVYMWPGQIVLCGGQTYWTAQVENGIANGTLPSYYEQMLSQLDDMRDLIRSDQSETQRLMLEAVITIEVHARDVLHKLIQENVFNVNDFEWISQLRYYWVDESDLNIRMVNAEFRYGYEYLGNNGRLVITPLTDRCYLTLTGALHMKFGGAPAGPAGTGKTETTKDLAKAFAIQCVVFNCSDQLDFVSMGKFFKGLASSGAWACFDEFNRIDIEVLSVIAQQIMTIQKAQQIRANTFAFEGVELVLRHSCAVFITMNPGYAGRTELPDNLKALFRPVAMMVPNYALIAEISLFSYGFSDAKNLAEKITTAFKLSSEQLSTQDHYDFGMRAVKTVIAVAGNLRREQKGLDEQRICLRALRDVNNPKFLKDDLRLFDGIVSDLFPRLTEQPADHGILEAEIRKSITEMGLEDVNEFVKKVIQLYETTMVRHGLMLVGPTGSGKTKCYSVLKDACTNLKGQLQPNGKPFTSVVTYVLNPKSVTMGQLYGEYDLDTHEWTDGILPSLLRADISVADESKRWYIFDGPVDAVWIENMNTVLDDNKKLCLTSGEIMKLLPTHTMMFEVADLRVASPATVSRCGMVFMEPEDLGLKPLINCWIKSLPMTMNDYVDKIIELSDQFVLPGLEFLRANLREIVATVDSGVIQNYINLMNFRIGPMAGREGKSPPSYVFQKTISNLLSPWVAFAVIWSLGGTCDYKSRCMFSDWVRSVQKTYGHPMPLPEDGLVFDYRLHDGGFTDPIDGQEPIPPKWYKWLDNIPPIKITAETRYADIEVPTMDNVRSTALIGYLLVNESNVLCVGPTGSGKTLTISAKLTKNMSKKYICDFLTFSARTTPNQTQDYLDGKLDKRRKMVYGPPLSKKQVFFVDDLNMPSLDAYGAQPAIELIRQFMDFSGWYDRREIGSFRLIEDVNFVGAMGPPGGGRNPITARLLRHFHFIAFPEMEDGAKVTIFSTILNAWLPNTPHFGYMLDDVVDATLNVFNTVCNELLPTPDKSHYTFNIRDLSKVFQGILMANPRKIQTKEILFLLWYHENLRVYSDRLVNDSDRKWFNQFLRNILQREFDCNTDRLIGQKTIFYGDFCNTAGEYEEITDLAQMEKVLLDFLEDYNNSTTSPMNLVLFRDAMDHLCRITRILRQPRGNGLLLGVGGSGRQSLTKLSAYMEEYECFQIELSKSYTMHDWQDDIKNVMLKSGLQNQNTVFLFSESQIKDDSMLEDINSILNSGDVPNIYQPDEIDKIYQAMRGPAQEAGLQINRSNLFSRYLNVVKNNLHTVITMSPIGEIFRARIRQFPALVNCCTIDWFCSWPDIALQTVATHFLASIKDESITESILKSIVKTCQYMHSSVTEASDRFRKELDRHNYVTPTSYLELLSSYGDLLEKRKNELKSGMTRLSTGLRKLASTEAEVKDMQDTLRDMKPDLERAAEATAKMIDRITRDTIEAEKMKAQAIEQEQAAAKLKSENKMIRDGAEADLSEVKPMLEAAETSLKSLNKNDITELKAMKRPPVGVLLIIEAICIVNNVKPLKLPGKMPGEKVLDYWTSGSQMLADPGHFLHTMENYRREDITEEMINKLKNYIENPNFQPEKVIQVSKACHSLCLWVHAMYNYYFVNLKVAPKMEALAKAEEILAQTERTLNAAIARLTEVQEGIEELQRQLQMEEERKNELEKQKQLCEDRMSRAVKLIAGLSEERHRWSATVTDMQTSLKNAIGDILLSSGAVAYLTPFTDTYRESLMTSWYKILGEGVPHTLGCNPVSTLGDPMEIRKWQIDGLPRDSISVENAVLVMHSKRWPLFIDPQGQANKWIRNMCKTGGLSVVKMTDKDILRVVENCVRFGKTCLIENVGMELEASLDPILMRSFFKHSGQTSVKVGDSIVPYNFDFRLYLTTKLTNPHYTPEVCVKILLVNFALTVNGLLDQMLTLVTVQERPDLEQLRNALIVSNAEMKRDLKEIEDRILYRLSVSEGSVVDDTDLILTLDASKMKSNEIKAKMEAAEITQADIDATRSSYTPVAKRAQILFFCLSDLQRIDAMYQYSLEWFIGIFNNSILSTEKADFDKRALNINQNFTFTLFANVCRSLFEKHKLLFAFLVCVRIRMNDKLIDSNEWKHFLTGAVPFEESPNPAPEWITPRCWKEVQALDTLSRFQNFVESFRRSLIHFKEIFDAHEAHLVPFPQPWQTNLDDFQKMLILKCLRPDKVINAMQIYLKKHLGEQFVEPQTTELSAIYKESSPVTPIVFVLSSGTDPAVELHKFADKLKMGKKLHSISLGQGQGPRAEAMMKQSMELGCWVFFQYGETVHAFITDVEQNCHLAPSWMPKLEALVENLSSQNTHRDFRLWLTSTPSRAFPTSILQSGCKMTIEPPRSVKANMFRSYLKQVAEMQDFLQSDHPKAVTFKRLVFSLCMFHSILLERRKFGPLGFNIPYEFTDSDLTICMSQLHMFLTEYEAVPFKVLIYTAGHINYGGRITDDWDRRCVITILEDYYNQNVMSLNYQFDLQGFYRQLPNDALFKEYINYIKTLPLNDDPSLFGMHPNADISYAQAETYACLETLSNLQSRKVGNDTLDAEEVISRLINAMLSSIPNPFDVIAMQLRYPILYEESFNTVLLQEAKRYNSLLDVIKFTLENLLKASRGLIVMSEQLETIADSLLSNKIPNVWQEKGYPSLKPLGAWFHDLKERISFINTWQEHGVPPAFWISGFYFPQAFLTGALQNFARKYVISINAINFNFQVLSSKPTQRPKDGCVIYGMFLEGCRWNGKYLAESLPKELHTEMSPIFLLPEVHHKIVAQEIYICPVYKTMQRAGILSTTGQSTNFVLAIEIPSQRSQAHWIKRGVALICSLDY